MPFSPRCGPPGRKDVLAQVAKELAEQLIRLRQLPHALARPLIISLGKVKLADLSIQVEKESRKVNGGVGACLAALLSSSFFCDA